MSKQMRPIRFIEDVFVHTAFLKMVLLLIVLWLLFASGLYLGERQAEGTTITSYGRALYWGIAAFSTAGIADAPLSGFLQLVGGIWIVVGSALFFGTIEYNLEQLDELSIAELDLLKETTDTLIEHMEQLKEAQLKVGD